MHNAPQPQERLWPRGTACPFDEVIDVRSPGEYAADHLPGAINLPVLSDAERAEVGTMYHQVSAFAARKRGAALISHTIGELLSIHFADKTKDYRPLLYCFRGGQRSGSIALVLAQIGWRVTVLNGGYKTYRAHVRDQLEAVPPLFTYRVLAGATGTAKTLLLNRMAELGAQVIDLEALANHRGSILGHRGPQPTQKYFESLLLNAYDTLDPNRPVWLEAESHRIGNVALPAAIWNVMTTASVIEVQMPLGERVKHLLSEYNTPTVDAATLKANLRRLEYRIGRQQLNEWDTLIDNGDWTGLVASLLQRHYDPAYAHSASGSFAPPTETVSLTTVSDETINELAAQLAKS
ncbi:tRNA 2-selenouridine(34) synthase MnmH [soil metagenome]